MNEVLTRYPPDPLTPAQSGRTSPCAAGCLGGGTPRHPQGREVRSQCCEQPVTAGRLPGGSKRAEHCCPLACFCWLHQPLGQSSVRVIPEVLSLDQAQDGRDLSLPTFYAWGMWLRTPDQPCAWGRPLRGPSSSPPPETLNPQPGCTVGVSCLAVFP